MDVDVAADDSRLSRRASSYTTRLDRTLKTLQDRVKEHGAALEKLRASTTPIDTEPSSDPKAYLQQLHALKVAYESLTPTAPWLPPASSPIPGLLALRATDRIVKETQESITAAEAELKYATRRLEKEEADLRDAKLIQDGLKARIFTLQVQINQRTQKSSSQIVRDIVQELEDRKSHYDDETRNLVKAFNSFIDDHLAPMLAVEELGGPIVGEQLDIDNDLLEGAFNAQGKAKKGKLKDDKRQRRIDGIWGPQPDEDAEDEEPWTEKIAAAAEMRELTEQLLNAAVGVTDDGPGAYVGLTRESAAARFLVRSKVAHFHPRDAMRLRLVDFGGEIDD